MFDTLSKTSKFHLTSLRGNVVGVYCFSRVSGGGNWAFPQNFYNRKVGEITVFYAVTV